MKTKKRKNKLSKAKLNKQRIDKYLNAYKKEMNEVFSRAKLLWDEIILDNMTSYDLVVEEATKTHMKWTDFLIDKGCQFWTEIDKYQHEIYDDYWIIWAWMYSDIRAFAFNAREETTYQEYKAIWLEYTKRPERKPESYFQLDFDWLNQQQVKDAKKMLNRLTR